VLGKLARPCVALLVILGALAGCGSSAAPNPRLQVAGNGGALGLSDALEALIDDGRATAGDRSFAYDQVIHMKEDSAEAAYARAVVTARLVEVRGLRAAPLVRDVEREAERSRQLDPGFRDGAATQVLGMLYVMAPGALLAHGNSERGIALLEALVKRYPDVLEHRLRLGEAYLALSDLESAEPHMCHCLARRQQLKREDQRRLARLFADNRELRCPGVRPASNAEGATTPPATP
jgi:hypothetical protein